MKSGEGIFRKIWSVMSCNVSNRTSSSPDHHRHPFRLADNWRSLPVRRVRKNPALLSSSVSGRRCIRTRPASTRTNVPSGHHFPGFRRSVWTICIENAVLHRAFPRFGQAKFADGGSILGSSQFSQLPQLPLKTTLNFKKGQNRLKNNHHLPLLI